MQNTRKGQNALLVIASYIFYGWWDCRFLGLILFSTLVDYFVGLGLRRQENPKRRKSLLLISILVNIGLLGYFKYANFFLDNFVRIMSFFGQEFPVGGLNIILPVGISFYTFQTLSYSIDVYRKKIEPTGNLLDYAVYVSFFPQLIAGPIERATHLLPQFLTKRDFSYARAVDGLRQILWGLFKKIVVADSCARYVDEIFTGASSYSGSTLLVGGVFFAFQIYGDFSGYSDIAIGVARLFGFDLLKNFSYPYFSRDIAEFWRRWHISLTTWFRDYVYIPLGGSREGLGTTLRNIAIIFLVSGFWHGASWTFILWGGLNALYFIPLLITGKNRDHLDIPGGGNIFPSVKELFNILITFGLTTFAWIFFRAEDINQLGVILRKIFSASLLQIPAFEGRRESIYTLVWVLFLLIIEWFGREDDHALKTFGQEWHPFFRWAFYYGLIYVIYIFSGNEQQFIYFQF